MENRLIWNERYNTGVDIIDREHRKLFSILNKLFDFVHREEKGRFACQEAIKYFRDHAIQHFADEETYMASIDYPGLDAHRRIHRDFRELTLPALEGELEMTRFSATSIHHFLGVCAGWLVAHTLIEDQMIVSGEPVRHWENLLPEEEQAVMGQTVATLLHSMFRLDCQLISSCYAGEKFGDGICCRLVYSDRDEKRWEFFLLFEEQLIGSAIGNVIAAKSETTDMILSNVARYAARQLIERLRRHFSSLRSLALQEEQLLTYEQFFKRYERQCPQFSFLFDTGRGYFACCMAASGAGLHGDGISAVTENALAELERRLCLDHPTADRAALPHPDSPSADSKGTLDALRPTSPLAESTAWPGSAEETVPRRKKILVVDDSDFMRKALLDLLGQDYEVLTADSGISAIRSITLARPDLVLLDYEMPVCSGSQMLEMIRSDKDLSDIPVIFLTCRVDRESVKKAISLKPEGYLSKSLPAESVKREIDRFFGRRGSRSMEFLWE